MGYSFVRQPRFMKHVFLLVLGFFLLNHVHADSTSREQAAALQTASGTIYGTLMLPVTVKGRLPVALLIAGSGPTDRNGNTPLLSGNNNSLLYLAQALAKKGIATLRYDKRGIGASAGAMPAESGLRFDTYVADAIGWIVELRKNERFGKVFVIGHSEGSTIGMLAAAAADGYVSIAGPGFPADSVLRRQLAGQPKPVKDAAFPILDSLRAGFEVKKVHPFLLNLFRPSVQPYLISWLKHDPRRIIAQLKIPVLIAQGDKDLKALVEDARALQAASPGAVYLPVKDMNHVLKIVESTDRQANLAAYSDPALPVAQKLVDGIAAFILKR